MKVLTAFYDFAVSPASYDFLKYLAAAESYRRYHGFDHLHVMFVPAPTETKFRIDRKPNTTENKVWRLHNLCVPLCHLYGATYTVLSGMERTDDRPSEYPTFPPRWHPLMEGNAYWFTKVRRVIEQCGLAVPEVEPEAQKLVREVLGDETYITITIRQTGQPERNSDLPQWEAFTRYLKGNGERVIVVPDTDHACVVGVDPIGSAAAINPLIRHALYAGARMNMGVGGGPLAICWFGGLPFISFKMVVADQYNASPEFFKRWGLPVGEQFPWAKDRQWIQWDGDDTLENLTSTYRRVMGSELRGAA